MYIVSSVTTIGNYAFSSCNNLETVYWNVTTCTSVGTSIFGSCSKLATVVIGDNVTTIPSSLFNGCSGLTSVTIPDSVTTIGSSAFYGCSGLTNVYYMGTVDRWNSITIASSNSRLTSATRYYYSETEPTEEGNYWHYDDENNIVVWKKEN